MTIPALPPANGGSTNSTSVIPSGATEGITGLLMPNSGGASGSTGINIPQAIGQFLLGSSYDIDKGILIFFTYGIFTVLFLMLFWVIISDKSPVEIVQTSAKNVADIAPLLAE